MLSRDHNILWLPESNGYPTSVILPLPIGSRPVVYTAIMQDAELREP